MTRRAPAPAGPPEWFAEYGVHWPWPMAPAPARPAVRGNRFTRLPTAVQVLLILAAPVLLWLAVCVLAVGGWIVILAYLVMTRVCCRRRPPAPRRAHRPPR